MSAFILLAAAGLCIASVHDGDTVRLCDGERVRLQGIDAPELEDSPRCSPQQRQRLAASKNPAWCNDAAGARSRDALQAFVLTGRVSIERLGTDRYGRTLANIYVNGNDAGDYLIRRGLARLWRK
jgi:endonuclease YncB( thermonuclease family)